jgi:hypothetical protein
MQTFTVTGIDASGERWSGTFEARDAYHAEQLAREVAGERLQVAAVIGADRTVYTAGWPPASGPGTPGWDVVSGTRLNDDPNSPPSVGDYVYMPYCDGGHPSAPDELPGLARVKNVHTTLGSVMIEVEEHGGSMSWPYLARMQRELHRDHRYEIARIDEH